MESNFKADPYLSPLNKQSNRDDTKSPLNPESLNIDLSEWSTTERLARIQEAGGANLRLQIKSSKSPETLTITPKGLDPARRSVRDGVVYFGCKHKDSNGTVVVDYKTKINKKKFADDLRGPHFMIYYDLNSGHYYLHDLLIGFGTFVKINHTLVLANEQLLNIGEFFVLVNVIPRYEGDNYPKLRLKVVNKKNESEVFYFNAQEFYLSSIVIGRSRRCHVFIDDGLISKAHASVIFTADQKWVIIDGTTSRGSLNGTWVYAGKDWKLEVGNEFKACEAVFKVVD